MHTSHERAERADLGRRIEAPTQRVGEIEVAAERRRGDERGKRLDAIGGEQPLETEAHAALGGGRAECGERVGAAVEIVVRPDLRLEEERDQDDVRSELGGEAGRPAHVLRRRLGRVRLGGCDAAVVVIAEHERVDLERCGCRIAPQPVECAVARAAELRARDGELEPVDAEPLGLGDDVVHLENRVHDGQPHRAPLQSGLR